MLRIQGKSTAILFLGLSAAFDSARELAMGGRMRPEDLASSLQRLDLDAGVVEAIVSYRHGGNALQRAGVEDGIADLVCIVHESTWFQSRGCSRIARSRSGTRARDPLGDVLFNLVFTAVLRWARKRLQDDELAVQLQAVAKVSGVLAAGT